jgi:hypothetical protein
MNTRTRTTVLCLAAACAVVAAKSPVINTRLTPHRIAELNTPGDAPSAKTYTVEISGLVQPQYDGAVDKKLRPVLSKEKPGPARVTFLAGAPKGVIQSTREFRYPIEFEPPKANPDGATLAVPTTPKAFETTNTGWIIELKARPAGKLIAVAGKADCTEFVGFTDTAYGALAGPIYDDKGKLITPNVMHQPKFKTITSRFYIFAEPGEPYEITLYLNDKPEKHTLTIKAD